MIAFPKQVTGLECPRMKYKRREWQRREKAELSSTEGRGLTRPAYKMCIFPTVFPRACPSCIVLLFLFSPHFLSSSQGACWEDMLGCGSVLKIIFTVLSKKTICWREAQSRLIRNSLILLAWTEWWDMWIERDDGKLTDAEPKIKPSPQITHLLLHPNPASTPNHWWQDTHRWSLNQSAEETQMGHWGALQEITHAFHVPPWYHALCLVGRGIKISKAPFCPQGHIPVDEMEKQEHVTQHWNVSTGFGDCLD